MIFMRHAVNPLNGHENPRQWSASWVQERGGAGERCVSQIFKSLTGGEGDK